MISAYIYYTVSRKAPPLFRGGGERERMPKIGLENEIQKQKKCPECGGIAFTIWKVVPPPFKIEYKCDLTGEDQKYEKNYKGEPQLGCISCGKIQQMKTVNYVEVEEIDAIPNEIDFISLELRHSIDLLIRYIEWGMVDSQEDLIEKVKSLLPLPFEGYTPLYESK